MHLLLLALATTATAPQAEVTLDLLHGDVHGWSPVLDCRATGPGEPCTSFVAEDARAAAGVALRGALVELLGDLAVTDGCRARSVWSDIDVVTALDDAVVIDENAGDPLRRADVAGRISFTLPLVKALERACRSSMAAAGIRRASPPWRKAIVFTTWPREESRACGQSLADGGGLASVRLVHDGCYWRCPAYSVALSADGTVEWNGVRDVDPVGPRRGRVAPGVLDELASAVDAADIFCMADRYEALVSDSDAMTVEVVRADGAMKRVREHAFGAPRVLGDVAAGIEAIARSSVAWDDGVTAPVAFVDDIISPCAHPAGSSANVLFLVAAVDRELSSCAGDRSARDDVAGVRIAERDELQRFLDGAPDERNADRARLRLAALDARDGRGIAARRQLGDLLAKLHLDDDVAAAAAAISGDLSFAAGDAASARRQYERARERAHDGELAGYLTYRLAWCDIRDGKRDDARTKLRVLTKTATLSSMLRAGAGEALRGLDQAVSRKVPR